VRILYFTRNYTVHDQRFLTALSGEGFDIQLLFLEKPRNQDEAFQTPDNVSTIQWIGVNHPLNWYSGYSLHKSLQSIIEEVKPDLIHAGPIQSCAFLSALTGFHPLISVSWGYDLLIDAERNGINHWITKYALRNSDVLVGDCQTIRKKAEFFGTKPEQIVTFPWGIDLDHFKLSDIKKADNGTFTLLSTRAWEPIYGVDIIAHAFVKAVREVPQLRLVMLGNGSQEKELHRIFSTGNALEKVVFAGQVKQAELPSYYQNADLYVSATYSDGTSISLLEALACGTPALVSDLPGNQEWINPGVQGWLFPEGDSDRLKEGIFNAWNNRDRLAYMGKYARVLAESRADWNKNFPVLLEAYKLAVQLSTN
jgi:glycosyltransferase involved in cell wall biosynthesis